MILPIAIIGVAIIAVIATVNNSTMVKDQSNFSAKRWYIFGKLPEGSEVVINGTTLIGKPFFDEGTGKIILGDGTKIDADITAYENNVGVIAEGCVQEAVSALPVEVIFKAYATAYTDGAITVSPIEKTFSGTVSYVVKAVNPPAPTPENDTPAQEPEQNTVQNTPSASEGNVSSENKNETTVRATILHDAPQSITSHRKNTAKAEAAEIKPTVTSQVVAILPSGKEEEN